MKYHYKIEAVLVQRNWCKKSLSPKLAIEWHRVEFGLIEESTVLLWWIQYPKLLLLQD
jgi:hypothetical protein